MHCDPDSGNITATIIVIYIGVRGDIITLVFDLNYCLISSKQDILGIIESLETNIDGEKFHFLFPLFICMSAVVKDLKKVWKGKLTQFGGNLLN